MRTRRSPFSSHRLGWLLGLLLWALVAPAQAIELDQVHAAFPEATHLSDAQGEYPAKAVHAGERTLGYVFETRAIAPIPAYSGKPINLLVGIDLEPRITLVRILDHEEPIMLVGIPEQRLVDYAEDHVSHGATARLRVGENLDAISGATVTVIVLTETVMRAARRVAADQGLIADPSAAPPARVRDEVFTPADWETLVGDGTVRRLHLTHGEIDKAFEGTPAEHAPETGRHEPERTFIDLYLTYLNAPTAGRNLLGDRVYEQLMARLDEGEHAIAVLARGDYSFKGSGYVRGGIFDRVELTQGSTSVAFQDRDHQRIVRLAIDGAPALSERDIFIVREEARFDPGAPWELGLLVRRASGPLETEFVRFNAHYSIPDAYVERFDPPVEEPLWVQVWRDRTFQILVLGAGLTVLTAIMLFQDVLVRHPRILAPLRIGFLIYTVGFIGWYSLAQLSVVNILTFVHSLMGTFSWESFLIDPMMFILWSFVAVTLLMWGRGVFCGWLCPFGAMQELINKAARRLRVPQYELPFAVHERLWALKYIILLALFAVSLHSLGQAERYAEVEPFKTAVTMRFQREWGFLLYALGLLAVSAFTHKAYCRYLCPLGAGLAIPARLRLFDWLKRHRGSCGTPCQLCAQECEVAAIHPDGRINANECHYCLDCQVTYHDDRRCPPMVKRRKRYEKAARVSSGPGAADPFPAGAAQRSRANLQRIPTLQEE